MLFTKLIEKHATGETVPPEPPPATYRLRFVPGASARKKKRPLNAAAKARKNLKL